MNAAVALFFSGQSFGDGLDSLPYAWRNNNLEVLDGRCLFLAEHFIKYFVKVLVGPTNWRSGRGILEEFIKGFGESIFLWRCDRVGFLSIAHGLQGSGQVVNDTFPSGEPEPTLSFLGEVAVVTALIDDTGLNVRAKGFMDDGNASDGGLSNAAFTAADMPYGVSDV